MSMYGVECSDCGAESGHRQTCRRLSDKASNGVMPRRLSTIEQELQEFHSGTRRGSEIDAHSLGILPDPADLKMQEFDRYSRQDLIARHQAHVSRLYEGIRQRAVEHAATVGALNVKVMSLSATSEDQQNRINSLWLAVAACAMVVAYFLIRDASCPVLPWIVKATQ